MKPSLPPIPTIPQRSGNNAATFTALIMLLGVAAGLFFLVVMIAPFALGILVIGFLFVPTALMHYFVWGNWLQEQHRREAEQEFRDDS